MQNALITLLLILIGALPMCAVEKNEEHSRHNEVVMRMIGHQVLLYVGDSTSQVAPIERKDDAFIIRFGNPFSFQPEALALKIDSVIRSNALSKHYIVEFVACDDVHQVIYSYERGLMDSIMPCLGRPQPEACYQLRITLLDQEHHGPWTSGKETSEAGNDVSGFVILMIVLFAFAAGMAMQWRSAHQPSTPSLALGSFKFDPKCMVLKHDGQTVELTGKEAALLLLLYKAINETVERDTILKEVWGDDGDYVGRTLDVFISKLRKKLEADQNVQILNVRGVGYKLVAEV